MNDNYNFTEPLYSGQKGFLISDHVSFPWVSFLCLTVARENQSNIESYFQEDGIRMKRENITPKVKRSNNVLGYYSCSLYEVSGRETLMTCVRMYPDVLPWEVMEICRQGMSRDPQTSAQYFVYYVEQLLRWRVDVRDRRYVKCFSLMDRVYIRRLIPFNAAAFNTHLIKTVKINYC